MENILTWVKSGLLFGILSSVILLLSPNKSYEKHMSLVVGLLFILVMIHPVMSFLNLDGQTYISYIQNYIEASENGGGLSESEIGLYGESVGMQLKETLRGVGYNIKDLQVDVDEKGSVYRIAVSFESESVEVDILEQYIKNVFGEEVLIEYER